MLLQGKCSRRKRYALGQAIVIFYNTGDTPLAVDYPVGTLVGKHGRALFVRDRRVRDGARRFNVLLNCKAAQAFERPIFADKLLDKIIFWMSKDVLRRIDLRDLSVAHNHNGIGNFDCLVQVVGNKQHGLFQFFLHRQELLL